ncbi:hypothetical protein [Bradyrhizobium sp. CCGUVB14]|uniref:hypothetical protein n=1 Tax=Bradyrhizobium sp. CCGUVB14 TaxID=2949628 RepID=UPI0020B2B103|nr:hypothetical protein [Bradyrhizobium sp. CCGUVB14]MCP3440837.1 hypothetical protein [Bradyrhizobium sp. CCGUVB14]
MMLPSQTIGISIVNRSSASKNHPQDESIINQITLVSNPSSTSSESRFVVMLRKVTMEEDLGKKAQTGSKSNEPKLTLRAASSSRGESKKSARATARPRIDSTLYFIERESDDLPLSHFEKFDIT